MEFTLRPAVAADQEAISAIVRQAGIYPRQLDWPRFLVAEREGRVIGVGQVRSHRDGSRELASIAVRPACRGQGVGSAMCQALIQRESGLLYLTCRSTLEAYYARFGFSLAAPDELPPHFRRLHGLLRTAGPILRRLVGVRLIVMKRERSLTP